MAIEPSGIDPVGDDQPWKRGKDRTERDLINALADLQSRVEALEGRVN